MFRRLLRKEHILLDLNGDTKEILFKAMLDVVSELNEAQKRKLNETLLLRESYGTTAVGDNIALPSVFSKDIKRPAMIMGISRGGLEFSALDGEPVHILLLLLLPEAMAESKRDLLQSAQRHFADRFFREQIQYAQSPEEVIDLLEADLTVSV